MKKTKNHLPSFAFSKILRAFDVVVMQGTAKNFFEDSKRARAQHCPAYETFRFVAFSLPPISVVVSLNSFKCQIYLVK